MDPTTSIPFELASPEAFDRDLVDIDAGIALVCRGLATRVRLVGLARPEAVAAAGLAHAQLADVRFRLEREPNGSILVTLGPRA